MSVNVNYVSSIRIPISTKLTLKLPLKLVSISFRYFTEEYKTQLNHYRHRNQNFNEHILTKQSKQIV